jgi:two-component system NtrC family sensor kinase
MPLLSRTPSQGAARLLRVLLMATVILPTAILVCASLITWQSKQREAWDRASHLTELIYESVSRLLDAQLLVLEQARVLTDGMDAATLKAHEQAVHTSLAAMLRRLPHVQDVFIVGPDGHVAVDGIRYPEPGNVDLNDRDYVRHFAQGGDGVFVSRLASTKFDGRNAFGLTIPRQPQNGQYAGVIATSVSADFFEAYFRDAATAYGDAQDRAITLRRSDGQLLVRMPPATGAEIPQLDAMLVDLVKHSQGQSGHFEVTNPRTGNRRLIAWRRLPDIGMVILTSIARTAVVRDWASSLVAELYFSVPSTLALFVIILLAIRKTNQASEETTRRENAEEAVRQSQKMEALGKLTGGVAHDFNNLLAVILGSAELAKTRPPEKIGRLLDNIIHAGQRAATLTRQLLSFSRTQSVAPRVIALRTELPRIMELLKPSLRDDIVISLDIATDIHAIDVDPGEFEIALLNIALNARDAMPDGGRFTISAANRRLGDAQVTDTPALAGSCVAIRMADTGPGMPPDVAARAFEPFFTTKEIGHGTGLGLSQVYGFARQAGGTVTIHSRQGSGASVTLFLPRTDKSSEPEPLVARLTQPPMAGRRVLLVEDNAEVAAITAEMLRSLGWEVVQAERAREALDYLRQSGPAVDLLISDVVMPDGISGQALAREARSFLPDLPILLASGYIDSLPAEQTEFEVLHKPFSLEQLTQAIRDASNVSARRSMETVPPA